jgi:hypothetical protein
MSCRNICYLVNNQLGLLLVILGLNNLERKTSEVFSMGIPKWCNKLQKYLRKLGGKSSGKDIVRIKLLGLEIQVSREVPSHIPHELTVVIPRVEYRLTQQPPDLLRTGEILLNSITIAHSPRFELNEEGKPALVGQLPADKGK